MTLRPIESEFSEYLQKEAKEEFPLDLTLDGPILPNSSSCSYGQITLPP